MTNLHLMYKVICVSVACFCVFLCQQSLMTPSLSDKSTISQSDNLWLMACLLSGKHWEMVCTLSEGVAIPAASSPLRRSAVLRLMWFIFLSPTAAIKAMQMGRRNYRSVWAFIRLRPAVLAGNKVGIIDSVWLEPAAFSPSCMKSGVFMWKLTSTYRPQLCGVWCICLLFTDAGTPLCLVSFLAIRATRCRHGWWRIHYPSTTQIHYFIFCQFWSNTCCILSICTLHLPYFSMKIRLLISFESPLLFVYCE